MKEERVYLYDVGHFRHAVSKDGFDIGETVYNCDMGKRAIIKYGKAPHSLLSIYPLWFIMEDAQSDLTRLGFEQINKTLWTKRSRRE